MIDKIIHEDITTIKKGLKGDFKGKTVLVAGGAGFIGSWLCDALVMFKAEVTSIDNLSTGLTKNIDHLSRKSEFRFRKADVCTFTTKKEFDYILHLASHVSPEEYELHPVDTLRANSLGSANLAELARQQDATMLYASTSEVYGDADLVPTPETYWGKVNPIGPRSCYDEGKRFSEAILMGYYRQYGLDVRIARLFNSFGPRLREDGFYGRVVSRFITQALTNRPITIYGDGTQTRSFCYVTDTVEGLLSLISNNKAEGEVVNIGNPHEITISQLAKRIKELTRSKSPLTFHPLPIDDPKRRCPDIRKIEKLLGWKPRTSFEEGLRKTVTWFQRRTT